MRRLVGPSDVGTAARQMLQAELEEHLAGLARPLPMPQDFKQVPEAEHVRRVQGVTVAVSVSGLSERPTRKGDRSYDTTWVLGVAVFVEDQPTTPLLTAAGDYLVAVVECVHQHQSLGGLARSATWTSALVDLYADATSSRLIGYCAAEFEVVVPSAVTAVPPATDPLGGPTVQSTPTTVTVRDPRRETA